MAHDVVVKETLSDSMVREGAELVKKLDQGSWQPSAALWFYFPDASAWRLILAFPDVATKGPREAYTAVQSALGELHQGDRELALENIAVMPADHPLINLLRIAITTGPGIGPVRFSRNVVNGQFIEDALIYRIT